jgi:segregation and condensation protein A
MSDSATGPLEVRLAVFHGPIEVLLELVSRRKLEIDEVSIAQVVDDFLNIVEDMRRMQHELDLDAASKFLLVAATLIHIKTRRLLPATGDVDVDEDLLVDAERDVLLARLLAARTFRQVAEVLRTYLAEGSRFVPRLAPVEERFRRVAPDLLRQVQPVDLARLAAAVLSRRHDEAVQIEHIAPIRASVADAVTHLCGVLPALGRTTYAQLCAGVSRLEAVVCFLAVLELLKAGAITVEQAGPFTDIGIAWRCGTDPQAVLRSDGIDIASWDSDVALDLSDAKMPERMLP